MAHSELSTAVASAPRPDATERLDLTALFRGRSFVVIGGTGFLGKVWWALLLARFPEVEHLYLVVRPKGGRDARARFDADIATTDVLRPLREQHGARFDTWLREKVTPIAGDVVQPYCGIEPLVRDKLRGNTHAVLNVAGVVDFDPPLDEALEVNAFGCSNLVALARDLGDLPLLHTSTCFVAGDRSGQIEELDPRAVPFPRCEELPRSHWDPDREIAECLDVVEQARHRASDAFRQSRFHDEARKHLEARGEPASGKVLEAEIVKVRRRFVEAQLSAMGMERAQYWGFPNTYTYTKSIGEQIIANSGLPFAIGRPAVVESTLHFPFPGWNEGINTSAPLIYALREGQLQFPGSEHNLDIIPCDHVAAGLTLTLAELLAGQAKPVYQYGSSDSNPCSMRRFFELSGLYKRQYYQRTGRGGPILSAINAQLEGAILKKDTFERLGPKTLWKGSKRASEWLGKLAIGPAESLVKPAAKALYEFSEQQRRVYRVLSQFVPFTAHYDYTFRCDATRAAYARLSPEDQARVPWNPEELDWRSYFLDVHVPALERYVFPAIDKRIKRPKPAPQRHETLTTLLTEMAQRFDRGIALQRTEATGLSHLSFEEWRARAAHVAARLQALGIGKGDRVLLAGQNHPAWAVAVFGILWAGATAVPVDPQSDGVIAENLLRASHAKAFLLDSRARKRMGAGLEGKVPLLDLWSFAEPEGELESVPAAELTSDDVALLIYTSGTTGHPKGVMLSHGNLTALVASLSTLFPLGRDDRLLSVLPIHHTFELTCGLLLPLSRGARVVYLDELTSDRLESGLKSGRITAMVGVPALWEMLERRISSKVKERGRFASAAFDAAVELNRLLGKQLGVDAGRVLFGPVHQGLGGELRYLVSGAAALPEHVHQRFAGLGLHIAEGYGLTEASPVLTVSSAGPRSRSGHVGKPVPGVDIKIDAPNDEGVGEVLARGANVMLGYADDADATRQVLTADGWLRTGDLGKLDRRGHLIIVGRAKDTIVSSSGENVYPEDVEGRLGPIAGLREYTVVGVPDPRGGERIGFVGVVERAVGDESPRADRHDRVRRTLDKALAQLPQYMRPALVTLVDDELPRTATKKVKRNEVRKLLEAATPTDVPSHVAGAELDSIAELVRSEAASIARRERATLNASTTFRGDLGFDSLMAMELLVALEAKSGVHVDSDRLARCNTIGEAEHLLRESGARRRSPKVEPEASDDDSAAAPLLPAPLRSLGKGLVGVAHRRFFDQVMETTIAGERYVPHNRNTVVVANHASHLDVGLVQYALGKYGDGVRALAARDYFFEGPKLWRGLIENFTDLVPHDRHGSLKDSLEQVEELLDRGHSVLVFPEGTRSTDGRIGEFKSAVFHLVLKRKVDVLPLWLGGTFDAFPKGANTLRSRRVEARIGPPLEIARLEQLTAGLAPSDAARVTARLAERAVRELGEGRKLELSRVKPELIRELAPSVAPPPPKKDDLSALFEELGARFRKGVTDRPLSYYFALDAERWTVQVDRDSCTIRAGKHVDPADCVLKTSSAIFTRIVREHYTPSAAEFLSGSVKSNNVPALLTFKKLFGLEGQKV